MADNDKITTPEQDPKVVQPGDGGVPNELPHHSWMFDKHKFIETNATLLLVLSFLVVTIGGIVEIAPLFYLDNTIEEVEGVRPYSPLETKGREIYIREGCYVLPLPDDPADARRGGTLRALLARRRIQVRPAVSLGLPSARGRTSPGWAGATRTSGTSTT